MDTPRSTPRALARCLLAILLLLPVAWGAGGRPEASAVAAPEGVWLAASDGGVFTRGDAPFLGSAGAIPLNQPVVGMAPTPTGNGYWLVAADGGLFTFGDARYHGSTGDLTLNQPVVGMAPTPTGNGYWLVAADGGLFTFGGARYWGSAAERATDQAPRTSSSPAAPEPLPAALGFGARVVAMASTPTGRGYYQVTADGAVAGFGDASLSVGPGRLNRPVVGVALPGGAAPLS
ncbi:MAG: hypothetical protein ACRDY7_02975, partial [Acidimicrobiia bacterium]